VCHTVSYSQQASTDVVVRTDASTNGTASGRFTTGGLGHVNASWTATATVTNNGYLWTKQIMVAVTQQDAPGAAARPVQTTFRVVPLVADPLSPVVPGGTAPC
jgi:hypothetical protein